MDQLHQQYNCTDYHYDNEDISQRNEIIVRDLWELMRRLNRCYNWTDGHYTHDGSFLWDRQLERILKDLQNFDTLHQRKNKSWTTKDQDGIAELSRMLATAAQKVRVAKLARDGKKVVSLSSHM